MGKPGSRITLAVDAMGGDKGPAEIIAGISKSGSFVPRDLEFQLFGREDELSKLVENDSSLVDLNVSVHHAPEVVEMDEKPIAGIKNKKKSSMALALQSLKEGEADALLSCGNTGCLMAGGTIRLRTLGGC